jgi:outer membrane protein W
LNDRGTNYINPANPASFSNITLTTFEAALVSKNTNYTSGAQSRTGSNTQFSHMAVAFPLSEKWGAGFGIRPYSSVGYDYSFSNSLNGNEITFIEEGSGGLNEIFMSIGAEITKNISVGVSGKYLFGTILDDRRVVYGENSTNFFNTYDQRDLRVSDFVVDLGVQYYKEINKTHRIIVGLKASPIDELDAERSQLIRNYTGDVDVERFKDTAFFVENEKTKVPFSPIYGVGLAYEKKKHWILTFDYTQTGINNNSSIQGVEFNGSNQLMVGYEKYSNLSSFGSYFKQAGYRAGASYNSSLVTIDGEDIPEFGISFGMSLPLRKSFSTLNIGVELGRRGMDEKGLTQEDFFNLQFGVTINDKWFIQRKYD